VTIPNIDTSAPAIEPSVPAEPQTPTGDWTGDRDDLGRFTKHVADEYDTTKILETIAAKDSITIADLKLLPEAKGYSDEQLLALWNEVNGVGNKAVAPVVPAAPRGWKTFNGDAEVTDFDKLTVAEFLKLQHEYTANGKQHRKTLDEVFRNASQGHYNAVRMEQITKDRDTAHQQWKTLEPKVSQYEAERAVWEQSLAAVNRGDYKPLQALLDAYNEALGAPAPRAEPAVVDNTAAGWEMYQNTVLPAADTLAREHGLTTKEVADGIMFLVNREPVEFFTRERFDQILQVEIPHYISEMKRERTPPATDARDAKIAELEAQLATSRGTKATEHNTQLDELHRRRKSAPPVAATIPGGNSVDSSGISDAHSAREWLEKYKG